MSRVPRTSVSLYREDDGSCRFLDWFRDLPVKAQNKCRIRLERLRELGHGLRRPEADFLRDGIYELRVAERRVQYRILYFLTGQTQSWCHTASSRKVRFRRQRSNER